ncbi:MAG: TolC family protein, partial [Rikenellaceae bacterium]|nr:TolC family protein [Rikenellaceae bacterium]
LGMLCLGLTGFGQLTIEDCYRRARENYPLIQQYRLIDHSEHYDLNNAAKAWLPQFSLSGKATCQTDVTSLPISLPDLELPNLSKDQYQILAEVSQSIWDGGLVKANKEAVRAQAEVDRSQFEVNMYAIKDRINNLFFGILLLDEQIRLSDLYLEDLQVNYNRIVYYLENGIAHQADLDAVRAEILTAQQNRTTLQYNRTAYLRMLSAFLGEPLDEEVELVKPQIFHKPAAGPALDRPEIAMYCAMEWQLEAQRSAVRASTMPQIGLFAQGGYGKPGLNMLEDKFKAFAIGGVRVSWNFGNFYTRRNNLMKIETGIRNVAVQQEVFLFNNELEQTQLESQYDRYITVMAQDDEIIRTRTHIVRASEVKLENGTISVTDLMRDMISAQNAKVNKAVHEIESIQTAYQIKNLTNN